MANRITAIKGWAARVAHDFAGNMTKAAPDKDGDWTKGYSLKWDAWNRLVEVRNQHDDTPVASYQYDGLFRRTHSTAGGNIRQFLYDRAWRIFEEHASHSPSTSSFIPHTSYCVWGLRHRTDIICRDADLPAAGTGSDSGSEGSDSSSTSIQRHYVVYDWISPTALLDPSTGDPLERYSYSAFGQRKIMDAAYAERTAGKYAWNSAFHGQFEDAETGWMNYGFRYLSTHTGRWLGRDFLAEGGGLNVYAFAANAASNCWDYLGRDTKYFTPEVYEEQWKNENPGRNQSVDIGKFSLMRVTGCIGVTLLNIGKKQIRDDLRTGMIKCYETKAQAEMLQKQWVKEKHCCNEFESSTGGKFASPRIFSIHLYDSKRNATDPETGKPYDKNKWETPPMPNDPFDDNPVPGQVDISQWDGQPRTDREGPVGPFDFGFLDDNGRMLGANNSDPRVVKAPNLQPMKVHSKSVKDWQKEYDPSGKTGFYNREVWCVACNDDEIAPDPFE